MLLGVRVRLQLWEYGFYLVLPRRVLSESILVGKDGKLGNEP